jgi:hypothetical protein
MVARAIHLGWPAGGGFTPASMAGLIAWYKADAGVTVDGSNHVTAVADQSVMGHNLVRGSNDAPSCIIPLTASFNGHLAFDMTPGNFSALGSAVGFAIGTGNKGSAFVMAQMRAGTLNFGRLLSYNCLTGGTTQDYDNAGSAGWMTRQDGNNVMETYRFHTSVQDTPISLATNYVFAAIFDGTNLKHYLNGTFIGQVACNMNWVSGGKIAVGSSPANDGIVGAGWDGPIAEVIITNADNTADVASVYAYAQSKYGI